MRRSDPLILGGGPAGSAAAITLAAGGSRPLLLERQTETGDAICGGFLSWHSLAVLARLGLEDLRGAPVTRLRLISRHVAAEAALPRPALGISRRQLDHALLGRAEHQGAEVMRGVSVREAQGRSLRLADGSSIEAATVLLATGKHDLRGLARPRRDADPALGLRVRLGPAAALKRLVDDAIELHLFDRGYAGLVLQEDGTGNLCLAVRKSRLAEAGGPAALLAAIGAEVPALGERLAHLPADAGIDAIAAVPYGWRTAATDDGLFRLGDQCGVIPSLAGEGMGIALASGVAAAETVLAGGDAPAYQARFAARTRRPIAIARLILAAAERPPTAPMLVGLMRTAPGLATLLARATRVAH